MSNLRKLSDLKLRKPFDGLFSIDPEVLKAITKDMKKVGYDQAQPVVVWDKNGELTVIDGHTRVLAAKQAGLEEIPVSTREFPDEDAALDYALHNQRDRRNWTDAEIARVVELVDQRRKRGGDRRSEEAKSKTSNEANEKPKSSAEETAKKTGISKTKVERTRTALSAPETKDAVLSGEKSINAAAKEVLEKKRAKSKAPKPVAQTEKDEKNCETRYALSFWEPYKLVTAVYKKTAKSFKLIKEDEDWIDWSRWVRGPGAKRRWRGRKLDWKPWSSSSRSIARGKPLAPSRKPNPLPNPLATASRLWKFMPDTFRGSSLGLPLPRKEKSRGR
jgi:ParB family chromosome partitioning protein